MLKLKTFLLKCCSMKRHN